MNQLQSPTEFETILRWNLVANVISLLLFLLARRHPLFVKGYDVAKYFWALQVVVALLPPGLVDARVKVIISYGFGFDYKLLDITETSVSAEDVFFRFATNFVHHLTLLDTTTNLLRFTYAICWLTHLFPWLRLFNRMDLFKRFAQLGNFAPAFAFVWLVSTGDIFEPSTIPPASRGILFMMVIYRGLYINCSFHILSTLGFASNEQEDAMKPEMKKLTFLVSLGVITHMYLPSSLAPLAEKALRSILIES